MAQIKKRMLVLTTGKQIKLTGISITITPGLEIGEGFTTSIFGLTDTGSTENSTLRVSNPHQLTKEELHEIADFIVRCCIDFKENIREHDLKEPGIFRKGP